MYVITTRQAEWPSGANTTPSRPIFTCSCGAQSSNGNCPRGH